MKVACFCGTVFTFATSSAHCPQCGQPVMTPRITDEELAEMRADLAEILGAHDMPKD